MTVSKKIKLILAMISVLGNCSIPLLMDRTGRPSEKKFQKKNIFYYNLRDFSDYPITEDISVISVPDLHKGQQ